jgi:hypothetical protein
MRRFTFLALAGILTLGLALNAQASNNPSAYKFGDVFVSVGNSTVEEFTPTGVLVQTLNDASGSTFTTGSAFDSAGNLYVTNFSVGTVSKFDNKGNLVNTNFITGQTLPESISFHSGGNFSAIVGDAGSNLINEYDSTGTLLHSNTALIQNRGTDWVDLQSDGHTVYYTSEGTSIFSYDIGTHTQNADFFDGLPGSTAYELRDVLTGKFAGDVLVADSEFALLVNKTSGIVMTYNLPGNQGSDFSLNLDPSGTAFWTADSISANVWEVDIATGAILEQWNTGTGGNTVFGVSVFGEKGTVTPEPSTLLMLGTGLLGLAGTFRKKLL